MGPSSPAEAARPALVRRALLAPTGARLSSLSGVSARCKSQSETGEWCSRAIDVEAPISWSNLAVVVVARRYFAREPGGPPERSVRTLIERVVGAIASWAQASGQAADADERDALHDELAALVLIQKATFATPVWLNAGLTERPFIAACFILKAEDSIPDLLDWNTREGTIFQQGGGAGINLSAIRSSREPVSRGGPASGPVSFMRATDAWAATIRAGGRARRGAKMVVLDASHPDVLEFIEAKAREEDRGRALLAAGYPLQEVVASLAFQHANHSVRVSDEFMRLAVKERRVGAAGGDDGRSGRDAPRPPAVVRLR